MSAPEPPPLPVSPGGGTRYGLRRLAAFAVSVALHLIILYALGATSWTTPAPEHESRISVVWLKPGHPSEAQRPAMPPDPPPEAEPDEPELQAPLPELPAPLPQTEAVPDDPPTDPSPDELPLPVSAPERDRTGRDTSPDEGTPDPAADAAQQEGSVSALALAEARRHVIERRSEDHQREASYRSFSADDWLADRAPTATPPPERVARPWPPCPIIERATVQFAMTTFGVCFRTRARTDPLSRLRLDYRQGLPICESVTDANGDEAYKCRLVPAHER